MTSKATRPGDFVTVRLKVVGGDQSGKHGCQVKPEVGVITFVEPHEILSVEHPLKVGDMVTWGSRSTVHSIRAIDGDDAWVSTQTVPLSALVRA